MQRILPPSSISTFPQSLPLFSTASTRRLEQTLAAALPPHTLMQRAGEAVARLAMALAPHAQTIWIACGPGNNGGDGYEAAACLRRKLPHARILISDVRAREALPADARASWDKARQAGAIWVDAQPDELTAQDLCIDALLGIGLKADSSHQSDERLRQLLTQVQHSPCTLLCVDIASGLDAQTGQYVPGLAPGFGPERAPAPAPQALTRERHTLALLTLQPGLFTGAGRDACGQIWWDELGADISAHQHTDQPPLALLGAPQASPARQHASHKGVFGDVAILGGEGLAERGLSMVGAAWLAALAAMHGGAGRVMLALLDAEQHADQASSAWPEIMLRKPSAQDWSSATVVCGCGGGLAIAPWLPTLLAQTPRLVLDADALNTVAASTDLMQQLTARAARGQATVLTPHPLEAARLLQTDTTRIQTDRLLAASELAQKFACTVVLKGSGSVIACNALDSKQRTPSLWINPTGNALLATGGTGDVLAGLIASLWAQGLSAQQAAIQGAYRHGQVADQWPAERPFSASALAQHLRTR
ncbi:MAG: NAD(P)H-hydrate dehydratase [Comamonas sp.]